MTDRTLSDSFFLSAHPAWSQRDLDETDQDVVDYLSAIQHEGAKHAQQLSYQAQREAAAARARTGRH